MQKFLNEEHDHFLRVFRKPIWGLVLFLFVTGSVGMTVAGILSTSLSYLEQTIFLELGLISCFFLVLFVVIPFIMRLVLNCLFRTRSIKATGIKNLPLGYIPPPPGKAPRWALKSFRETMA